ncbi:MAG: hypothetical protein MJ133_03835 [Lachnospiraceae bacterium]|nr:hypothetical protein [Lachnospiraceae bacterium]
MNIKITFEKYIEENGKIIFPAFNHNALYEMSLENREITMLARIPGSNFFQHRTFFAIEKYKSKFFLIPFWGTKIWIYDRETCELTNIKIAPEIDFDTDAINLKPGKFARSFVNGQYMYIFPHFYPALVIIDMETLEVTYDTDVVENLCKIRQNDDALITGVNQYENHVYCSIGNSNSVLVYNLNNHSHYILPIPFSGIGFNGIGVTEDRIILTPRRHGAVAMYDRKKKECTEIYDYPSDYNCANIPFQSIVKISSGYLLIPTNSNFFMILKDEGNIICLREESIGLQGILDSRISYDRVMAYGVEGSKVWYISGIDEMYYEFNMDTASCVGEKLVTEVGDLFFKEILDNSDEKLFEESALFDIKSFLRFL